ncbi:MAG: DUF4123 domain-containing protein [Polyangiaceae bacterium]
MTPRLIVLVQGGRAGGTKAVLDPGSTLRFGRTDLADVPIFHDDQLSSVHFDLTWDGRSALLRDRNSITGTSLGGLPVLRAEVPHGGWIRAGRTDFMVHVEGRAPSFEGADPTPEEEAESGRVLKALRAAADREPLFAIIDASRSDKILPLLRASVEPHRSLYDGVEGETLDHVAPYLVGPMRADSALLETLVRRGWHRWFGVYLTSRLPTVEIRRIFRRILMVELESTGEKVYFRFYDPRVLARLWPLATASQRAELTGSGAVTFVEHVRP